ncbi:MAG TPA: autotransporter-associated beta strand repeat-containing protein, partial [Tepidisphaeraceae bacterium]|nr:autotransporter-associated beta strand repeat-containing protein [Tepidisphaeraceae bacterium]
MKLACEMKSSRRILLAACAAVLAGAAGASGAIQTWSGGGGDDKWTTGANWLGGTAPVANDALVFDGSVRLTPGNDFAAGTGFTGIGFAATAGAFTLSGNQVTLSGDITDDAAGQIETIGLGLALDANRGVVVGDSAFLTINGVISGTGFGITKSGNGTLTLGGNNTYTGTTLLDGGTVIYTVDNLGAGAMNFGITPTAVAASTNTSSLDLTNANLTVASLMVQTHSATANTINIGTGKTLTVNGAFTVGVAEVFSNPNPAVVTVLNVTGDRWVVNGGANPFIAGVGRSNAATGTDSVTTLNLSGLSNFSFTGTNEFRVGAGNNRTVMTLANTSNSITANLIRIADSNATASGNNNGGRSQLHLGPGTNVIAANTINIGEGKSGGTLDFQDFNGTLRITGAAGGASTANIQLGSSSSATGSGDESQIFLAGHDVTVQAGNVVIGRLAGATGGNSARGNVTFDTGTFTANSIQLGVNSGGSASNGATGTLTLGGPFAGSGATGVLNVNTTFNLANRTNTNAAAGRSTGTFIINGGTANIGADILDASTTVSGAGANTTTLTLDGGTLNMSGHNIGTYSAPITTINLNSGTLNNVGRIAGTTINIAPTVTISGAPTYVLPDAGTLVSSLPVLTLGSGGGLEGGGLTTAGVLGDILADTGSHISMGTATAPGSLQFFNSLTLNNGSTVKFKLSDNVGSGNDFINTGVLNLSGTINLDIAALGLGPQTGNTYTLFNYSGALSGNETNFTILGNTSRSSYSILPTANTPGTIQLTLTGTGPLALTWVGNNGDNWDTIQTVNWKDAGNVPQKFFTSDQVTFDDSSTNVNAVQIGQQVTPGSVKVSAARDYKFAGAGGIAGGGNLTKELGGTLILATNNTYSGSTEINGGTVRVGDGGTTGSTGTGPININQGTLAFARSNALTVASVINGPGDVVQNGSGSTTLTGANTFGGGVTVNSGAMRLGNVTAAGTGGIVVNASGMLVSAASIANPMTLNGALVGTFATPVTFSGDVTLATGTTSTFRQADPQNLPVAAVDANEIVITGSLVGSGNMNVLSNGQDNTPDSGNGFRLRGTNPTTYSGTITVGNNVKFELQTTTDAFSPAGTGKIVMTAGSANLGTALSAPSTTAGYSEINLRNNSGGDTTFGNDIAITGSGLVILNPLGSAPLGTKITMGNLSIGTGQEAGVYLGANPAHVLEFTSVTLNGTATFSPKTPGFGADGSAGSDLSLRNISETAPSGLIMNGLRTLMLPTGNSYTGSTTVNSGTARVTNTSGSATGSGAVSVAGGATLTGGGIISGTVTAKASSHIVPGDATVGALTLGGLSLEAGSNLDFEGSGNTFDLLNVTDANKLTFGGNATLNLTELSSFVEGDYTLIDYAGAAIGSLSGKLTLGTSVFGGLQASLVDDAVSTSIKLHLGPVGQGPPQWNLTTSGSWSVASNWLPAVVPGGTSGDNAIANFLGALTDSIGSIGLDGSRTINQLNFNNLNQYVISTGGVESSTLTIDGAGAAINVDAGSHQIFAPLIVSDNLAISIKSGAALEIENLSIASSKTLTKSDPGALTIFGAQSHGSGSALVVSGGTVNMNSNPGTPNSAAGSNLSVSVTGSRITLGSDIDVKELTLDIAAVGSQTLDLNSPASAGAFRSVRVYAADLNAAKASLYGAIRNANAAGAADPLDGIIDSGLH